MKKVDRLQWLQEKFSPGGILALTIAGIILAEIVAMIVVFSFRDWPYPIQVILDTIVMTIIIFPLLYFLSFKPLLLHIKEQEQSESILRSRLHLLQYESGHNLEELLQYSLDEIETLTGSKIGFFHFLDAEENTIWLQAWSTNTLHGMCNAEGKDTHYNVERAGVWADAVRTREPIIHNNYASLADRKGMPPGHAKVIRELVVPILRDNKAKGILGLGNKAKDYTINDVMLVSTFADFAWDVIEKKRKENALVQSEEKFRTLADWTYDWELWLNPSGNFIYSSPSCERITGFSPEEFVADPDLLLRIVHPGDRQFYEEHHKTIHESSTDPVMIEYRIISRDGEEHWIEHACRPLFSPVGKYLGRRVSNRDVNERKKSEKLLLEKNRKEMLLTQTIQTIQTDIARDLHDSLGQNISFLRFNLADMSETVLENPRKQQIQNMTKAADESYGLIRAMLAILQLGDSDNPLSPFTRYANQIAERASFYIEITSQGVPNQLSAYQIRHLFYIFREALTNIEKYAFATKVTGEFDWGMDGLTLTISDNGCGFDLQALRLADHYGLKFMRDRAELLKGSILILSAPGQGTIIKAVVPYENEISAQTV